MDSGPWRIILAAVLGLAAAGADLAGGLLALGRAWRCRYLHYFIALGAGFILATAIFEMIRESLRLKGEAALLGMGLRGLVRAQVGYAPPLSAGVGAYVAASDLMPEVNRDPGIALPLLVFPGVGAMLLLRWLFRIP